ncbi:MAG TPA: MBL fold metallo-hydrolase [Tepidimicrobium sp.]|nr:MBL fold metallo-hydrolase [Tepidimicrobium sp.]
MGVKFCSLGSGSSGNCQYVGTRRTRLLVDGGFSGKSIENRLSSIGVCPTTIDYILVTHEHIDHIRGVGVLSRRYNIPILANEKTWEAMSRTIGHIEDRNIGIIESGKDFNLDDLEVRAFKVHHDAEEPVGYCIYYKNTKISIITDTGWVCDNMKSNIKGSYLYFMESNHDVQMLKEGSYPWHVKRRVLSSQGHMSNVHAGETLSEILDGCGEIILLAHLSEENNTPSLAHNTVRNYIENMGIDVTRDVFLGLTYKNKPTKVYSL